MADSCVAATGFENNTTEEFSTSNSVSIVATPTLSDNYCGDINHNTAESFFYWTALPLSDVGSIGTIHAIVRFDALVSGQRIMVIDDNNKKNPCVWVQLINVAGNIKLRAYLTTGTGEVGAENSTGGTTLAINTNYRIEMVYQATGGAGGKGLVDVYLNGSSEISLTHSTSAGYAVIDRFILGSPKAAATAAMHQYVDDIYLSDNATRPGNLTFLYRYADADGNYDNWRGKPTDTNRYGMVDEVTADDDTSVAISDKNAPHASNATAVQSFGLGAVASGKTIRVVKAMLRARSGGTGTKATADYAYSLLVRDGSDETAVTLFSSTGAALGPTHAYVPHYTATDYGPAYFELAPGGGAWTNAKVTSLEIGGRFVKALGIIPDQNPISPDIQEQWTKSAGTDSYALVDDYPSHDSDTTYIESATSGHYDQWTMESITADPWAYLYGEDGGSKRVKIQLYAKISAGSASDVEGFISFDGSTFYASDSTVTITGGSYALYALEFTSRPDDASTWYSEDLPDIAAFGLKHSDSNGTVRVTAVAVTVPIKYAFVMSQAYIIAIHDDVAEPAAPSTFVPRAMVY